MADANHNHDHGQEPPHQPNPNPSPNPIPSSTSASHSSAPPSIPYSTPNSEVIPHPPSSPISTPEAYPAPPPPPPPGQAEAIEINLCPSDTGSESSSEPAQAPRSEEDEERQVQPREGEGSEEWDGGSSNEAWDDGGWGDEQLNNNDRLDESVWAEEGQEEQRGNEATLDRGERSPSTNPWYTTAGEQSPMVPTSPVLSSNLGDRVPGYDEEDLEVESLEDYHDEEFAAPWAHMAPGYTLGLGAAQHHESEQERDSSTSSGQMTPGSTMGLGAARNHEHEQREGGEPSSSAVHPWLGNIDDREETEQHTNFPALPGVTRPWGWPGQGQTLTELEGIQQQLEYTPEQKAEYTAEQGQEQGLEHEDVSQEDLNREPETSIVEVSQPWDPQDGYLLRLEPEPGWQQTIEQLPNPPLNPNYPLSPDASTLANSSQETEPELKEESELESEQELDPEPRQDSDHELEHEVKQESEDEQEPVRRRLDSETLQSLDDMLGDARRAVDEILEQENDQNRFFERESGPEPDSEIEQQNMTDESAPQTPASQATRPSRRYAPALGSVVEQEEDSGTQPEEKEARETTPSSPPSPPKRQNRRRSIRLQAQETRGKKRQADSSSEAETKTKKKKNTEALKLRPGPKVASGAGRPEQALNNPPTARRSVYVFGANSRGQLGLGHAGVNVRQPTLNPTLTKDTVGVVQLAAGGAHCVALTHDNKILTWGDNRDGQLGRDTQDDTNHDSGSDAVRRPYRKETTPEEVDFSNSNLPEDTVFAQVAATESATFVLTEFGDVYGWGTFRETHTTPGDIEETTLIGFRPSIPNQRTPLHIPELKYVKKLTAGAQHVLALTVTNTKANDDKETKPKGTKTRGHKPKAKDGKTKYTLHAWGANKRDQLGRRMLGRQRDNGSCLIPRPCTFPENTKCDIASIGAGSYHSFAVKLDGYIYAWGYNRYGQTGVIGGVDLLESNLTVSVPTGMGLGYFESNRAYKLTGGVDHSIAVTDDGRCLSWGLIENHALGIEKDTMSPDDLVVEDGSEVPKALIRPTLVSQIGGVVTTALAGTSHSISVTKNGVAYAWGSNGEFEVQDLRSDSVELPSVIQTNELRGLRVIDAAAGKQFSVLLVE